MGAIFGGSQFNAKKAAADQQSTNDAQLGQQISTHAQTSGTKDAFGNTRQFQQNPDGTYTTVDTLGAVSYTHPEPTRPY